jgi:hypothetical protein
MASLKQGSWGEKIGAFLVGYLGPQALSDVGVGTAIYQRGPQQYRDFVDDMYNAAGGDANPENPWAYGGAVGTLKLLGGTLLAKNAYDYDKTGKISRAKATFSIPLELGMLLDGPELSPQGGRDNTAASWGTAQGNGGSSW